MLSAITKGNLGEERVAFLLHVVQHVADADNSSARGVRAGTQGRHVKAESWRNAAGLPPWK